MTNDAVKMLISTKYYHLLAAFAWDGQEVCRPITMSHLAHMILPSRPVSYK